LSENINLFENRAAIYNGKIVDTGAKILPLIHMYINRNLIVDCNIIGFKHTHTFVSHNCHQTSLKFIISLTYIGYHGCHSKTGIVSSG
jgi:hypothetical protein